MVSVIFSRKVIQNSFFFKFLLVLVFSFLFVNFVSANNVTSNVSVQEQASVCLIDSLNKMNELNQSGFSVQRVKDIYDQALDLYEAQLLLDKKQDFNRVISLCSQIEVIYTNALDARDSLNSLLKFYEDSFEEGVDFSPVDSSIANIRSEMTSERYELVQPLVDSTYQQITDIKAENTQAVLFYKSTTRGLKTFFQENWLTFSIVLAVLIILIIIFYRPIKKKILQNKLDKLNLRKDNLKKLVKKTQYDYFQTGQISDSSYEIRVKNFAEMIRDIDRQIPLLNEQIMKLSGKKWKQSS